MLMQLALLPSSLIEVVLSHSQTEYFKPLQPRHGSCSTLTIDISATAHNISEVCRVRSLIQPFTIDMVSKAWTIYHNSWRLLSLLRPGYGPSNILSKVLESGAESGNSHGEGMRLAQLDSFS